MRNAMGFDPDGSLQHYLDALRALPLLSREDERALARRFRERGDTRAGHRLVEANLRFVVKVAYEFRRYPVRIPDLVQEGNIGLMHAVRRFDPDRDVRLISFAVHWIRAHMRMHVMRSWSLVAIGHSRLERRLFFSLAKAQAQLAHVAPEAWAATGGTEAERVAAHLGVPLEAVVEMAARTRRDASLDAPLGDGEPTLGEAVAARDEPADQALSRGELDARLGASVREALARMNARERDIVERRFLSEDDAESLADLAASYGLSRERVRQLELRALERLRVPLRRVASQLDYRGARTATRPLYVRSKVKGPRARAGRAGARPCSDA